MAQATLFNAAVAVLMVGGVLYTHVRLHWLSGRSAAGALGCRAADGTAGALDGTLLAGIQQLRYQQRLLQSEQDAMLDTMWSQVHRRTPGWCPTSAGCIPLRQQGSPLPLGAARGRGG